MKVLFIMCGISVCLDKKEIDKQVFSSTVDVISHRGPDYKNCFHTFSSRSYLSLGHARLSIIDLSENGAQPMSYGNGRFWIVFNGEVYNYKTIRKDLEKRGFHFKSGTDTEVIVASYQCWGKACLEKFNGMFAFCIYDAIKNLLFLARDRFGIKPLYFCYSKGFFFQASSEIKQLLCYKKSSAKINWPRAIDFVQNREFDYTSETLFDGISQLRGGEALEVDLAEIKINKYDWYNLSSVLESSEAMGIDEAANEFYDLFRDSIRLRLRADVPVGSCLSGGLDSSSIVCLANRLLIKEDSSHLQNTFSSCFEDPQYDEREFIEEVTRFTKSKSHYTFPGLQDFWNDFDKIIWHQDEPIWSTSLYAQWKVFRLATQKNVKVMLDGQGADELLAGYKGMFEGVLIQARIRESLFNALRLSPSMLRRKISRFRKNKTSRSEWLLSDFKRMALERFNPESCSSLKELSLQLITKFHLPALLHYEDRNSMASSVEARVPFLDHRLVEFVLKLPDEFKLNAGISKVLLRRAMTNKIPEKIQNRHDKMGFVTPQQVWMFGTEREKFRNLLRETAQLPPFKASELIAWFDAMASKKEPFDGTLWRLIALGRWIEIFNISRSL